MRGIVFWTLTLPFGILLGILFYILKFFGRIEVFNKERFPQWPKKLIVASNHPSLWEPIILVPLFFPQYLLRPKKFAPWSTPDKGNYFDKWYWFFVRPRFIPVPRGKKREELKALVHMIRVLRANQNIIFFPEGGRTFKGSKFYQSPCGKKVRELKHGLGDLVCKTKATILPVWVEGTDKVLPNNGAWIPRLWRKMTIKIGNPINFKNNCALDKKQVTEIIMQALLALADENVQSGGE